MKTYSSKISLTKNSRGIYCIDTSIGCSSGMNNSEGGCYNDCYAAKSAKIYGYDFSKTVLRYFENRKHELEIIYKISRVKLDFVRIGCSGDPSENWDHCINILKVISKANKEIVIITKHWTLLSDENLKYISKINVCINTSVSALDNPEMLEKCLAQYNRIKSYCKSILRIVSCDFNLESKEGIRLNDIQHNLFKNESTLDTVFRPSKNNPLIGSGVINVKKGLFNGSKQLLSRFNKKTFIGNCSKCHQMCGINLKQEDKQYPDKLGIYKQMKLFN
jgi:hypothetical protein